MILRPQATIQKVLISTTSRLVGEYEKNNILLTHAWPDSLDQSAFARWSEGPISRSAFIFAFETEPTTNNQLVVPDYSSMGQLICSYLSIFFGKRFDNHGLVEENGMFRIPDLAQFGQLCDSQLPQNSHKPRIDFSVPLNLSEVSRIERLFFDRTLNSKIKRTFEGAAKFYLQALQNVEHDPEIAYLHLITAGEILSNFYDYENDTLLDEQTKKILDKIRHCPDNGEKAAKFISNKLRQIKRRFVETIVRMIDKDFFLRSETHSKLPASTRFNADTFRDAISSAYNLRSRYVHTGIPFGRWVVLKLGGFNNEMPFGVPFVGDQELGKILAKAPTYVGLERVMRYCLLQFAKLNGFFDIKTEVPPNVS